MSSLLPKCVRVPCPKCGAKIGETCKLSVLCHSERIAVSKIHFSQNALRGATENT